VDENTLNSRLSRISTIWTLLGKAHHESGFDVADAQSALIQRYQGAVYRYLLGALRDPDAAGRPCSFDTGRKQRALRR
jgi:hypothetical protein